MTSEERMALAEKLEALGNEEILDHYVLEAKENEASDINNGGYEAQLEFLSIECGINVVRLVKQLTTAKK